MTADPGTTLFLPITLMASKCVISKFTQQNLSKTSCSLHACTCDFIRQLASRLSNTELPQQQKFDFVILEAQ